MVCIRFTFNLITLVLIYTVYLYHIQRNITREEIILFYRKCDKNAQPHIYFLTVRINGLCVLKFCRPSLSSVTYRIWKKKKKELLPFFKKFITLYSIIENRRRTSTLFLLLSIDTNTLQQCVVLDDKAPNKSTKTAYTSMLEPSLWSLYCTFKGF